MARQSFNKSVLILIAILVGSLYIGPSLMIWKHFSAAGDQFVLAQYKTYKDPLQAYLPRAREIYDGHFPPSELYGDKQVPTVQNLLPSLLFSFFIFVFKGNINAAYLGVQFFFSGIIFILFYLLGQAMFHSQIKSMFFSIIAVLTPIAVKLPFYKWEGLAEFQAFFLNNFIPFARTQFDKLYLARIDEPLLTFPVYLSAILTFFLFWKSPKLSRAILAGISSGLLFYTYFHHWVYWVVVLGLLFGYSLFFNRKDKIRVKNFAVLFISLGLIATPYFITFFGFHGLDSAQDFIFREGVAFGRFFGVIKDNIADYLVYFLLAGLSCFLFWKKDRNKAVWILGLILAMFIVWNVQLVVGYVPVPHFFRRSISPVIFIILFNLFYEMIQRLEIKWISFKRPVLCILVLLSIFVISKKVFNVVSMAQGLQLHIVDYYTFPNDVVSSWNWINANLEHEPKIISPSTMTSFYLTTYTSARPFLATAFISLMNMKEIENRYLVSHKLFGVSEDFMGQRLQGKISANCNEYECFPDKGSNLNDSFWHIYGNYFSSRYGPMDYFVSGSGGERVIQKKREKIDELVERYREMKPEWKEINADYVFVGPLEKQLGIEDFSANKNLSLIYQNSSVEIYKIDSP